MPILRQQGYCRLSARKMQRLQKGIRILTPAEEQQDRPNGRPQGYRHRHPLFRRRLLRGIYEHHHQAQRQGSAGQGRADASHGRSLQGHTDHPRQMVQPPEQALYPHVSPRMEEKLQRPEHPRRQPVGTRNPPDPWPSTHLQRQQRLSPVLDRAPQAFPPIDKAIARCRWAQRVNIFYYSA